MKRPAPFWAQTVPAGMQGSAGPLGAIAVANPPVKIFGVIQANPSITSADGLPAYCWQQVKFADKGAYSADAYGLASANGWSPPATCQLTGYAYDLSKRMSLPVGTVVELRPTPFQDPNDYQQWVIANGERPGGSSFTAEEADGTPTTTSKLIFPNGSLTASGSGAAVNDAAVGVPGLLTGVSQTLGGGRKAADFAFVVVDPNGTTIPWSIADLEVWFRPVSANGGDLDNETPVVGKIGYSTPSSSEGRIILKVQSPATGTARLQTKTGVNGGAPLFIVGSSLDAAPGAAFAVSDLANTLSIGVTATLGPGAAATGGIITNAGSGSFGTVTSVATGAGLTGGPITGTGTVSLADMLQQRIKARKTASTGAPEDCTISEVLDFLGITKGDLPFRDTSAWAVLAGNTTTTKKFLRQTGTGSVSAAPAWDTLVAGDLPGGDWITATSADAALGSDYTATTSWASTGLTISIPSSGTYEVRLSAFGYVEHSAPSQAETLVRCRLAHDASGSYVSITNSECTVAQIHPIGDSFAHAGAAKTLKVTFSASCTLRLEAIGSSGGSSPYYVIESSTSYGVTTIGYTKVGE